jgi:hypothetical protein
MAFTERKNSHARNFHRWKFNVADVAKGDNAGLQFLIDSVSTKAALRRANARATGFTLVLVYH